VRGFGTPLLIIVVCLAILYVLATQVVGDIDDLPLLMAAVHGSAM
jgi:hypothetical protein